MTSLTGRSREEEQMDAAELAPEVYARILTDLSQVNTLTMSRRPTLGFLARALGDRRHFRLLDVGFGHGDMLRRIAQWAAKRNIDAELVGVDLNPKSAAIAAAATPPAMAIDYRTGDYAEMAAEFDFIISSLVTHHMGDAEIIRFLRFMDAKAARGWLVNDLHRHRLAHTGFPLLAQAMRWHRIVCEDGKLSVARSFRPDEWRALLATAGITQAQVVRCFPFRLCVERIR